jgi:hypothetical protein
MKQTEQEISNCTQKFDFNKAVKPLASAMGI